MADPASQGGRAALTLRVALRPDAHAELTEARDWYETCRPGLGAKFMDEFNAIVTTIVARPTLYPRVHGQVRRSVLCRFPYAVYFRVLPDVILVLAVVHGHRHPRVWRSRK